MIKTYLKEFKKLEPAYEIFMSLLALAASLIIILELCAELSFQTMQLFAVIDTFILVIFAADYFIRLFLAKDKIVFFKSNIIELIAIIPFNSIFQAARIVRFARLFGLLRGIRLLAVFTIFYKKTGKFLKTNNFHFTLYATLVIVMLSTIGICIVEEMSFGDALWWAFVTATTVGYGDISPKTPGGRIIAVVLMTVGIGFLGMLTGTISTYFINKKDDKTDFKDEVIQNIKTRLDSFDGLSDGELDDMFATLKSLKRNQVPEKQ